MCRESTKEGRPGCWRCGGIFHVKTILGKGRGAWHGLTLTSRLTEDSELAYYAQNTGDCDSCRGLSEKLPQKLVARPLDTTWMSPKGSSEWSEGLKMNGRGDCRIISAKIKLKGCVL